MNVQNWLLHSDGRMRRYISADHVRCLDRQNHPVTAAEDVYALFYGPPPLQHCTLELNGESMSKESTVTNIVLLLLLINGVTNEIKHLLCEINGIHSKFKVFLRGAFAIAVLLTETA